MQIATSVILAIIGFAGCFFLSKYICRISVKEMREERKEYEQEYIKWQGYLEKAKYRLEHPDAEKEHFSIWKRIGAFFSGIDLDPTLEKLNEYDWEFLKEPLKEPVYTMKRKVVIGLAGAVLFGAAGYGYGLSLQLLIILALFLLLIFVTCVDTDVQIIPPIFNILIFLLGIPAIWLFPEITILQRIVGIVAISIPLKLITLIIPGGFGGGDIKLMAAAGFLLGVKSIVAAFAIGLLLGGAYGIFSLVLKKKGRKEHFAFGPCLCVGIAVSIYCGWGIQMVDLYLRNFVH